jgi:transcription termination factor Rho
MSSVLDRDELDQSPLADLHLLANELGVDGFRRLRKPELIDAIIARQSGGGRARRARRGCGRGAGAAHPRPRARRGRGGGRDRRGRSGARASRPPRRARARQARRVG